MRSSMRSLWCPTENFRISKLRSTLRRCAHTEMCKSHCDGLFTLLSLYSAHVLVVSFTVLLSPHSLFRWRVCRHPHWYSGVVCGMSIVAQESFWGHLSFHVFVALTVQYCNPVRNLYKQPGFVCSRWPNKLKQDLQRFLKVGKKGVKKNEPLRCLKMSDTRNFDGQKKGLDDSI